MGFRDRLAHAWDAFTQPGQNSDTAPIASYGGLASYGGRPDRVRFTGVDRSIISSIYTRIGIDVAAIELQHVRLTSDGQYASTMSSGLNNCLTVEANMDQAARAFRQDIAMTMFDKGVVAVVPVETTLDPSVSSSYDIKSLRVGEVVAWFPDKVRILLYNDKIGRKEEITLDKSYVAIVENPLYSVMNEPNGTLKRLTHKLSLLDAVDEQASNGKLDMIIQLPYVIKSEARREQAETRRKDIEMQLKGSTYGIAYTDGTEKITQLNRPVTNNMLDQIQYLTEMLYGQLGLTKEVFNGTASEAVMLNYYNRTINPILHAITEEMQRTFLTKTARSQGQAIQFYRDPFALVTMEAIATISDVFARNEIMTSNEIRGKIGLKPSDDPKADMLVNSNMPQPNGLPQAVPNVTDPATDPSVDPTADPTADPSVDPTVDPSAEPALPQSISSPSQLSPDEVDSAVQALMPAKYRTPTS